MVSIRFNRVLLLSSAIALAAAGCSGSGASHPSTAVAPTATASPTFAPPLPSVEPTPADTPTPAPPQTPFTSTGTLTISPASGPIGSVVHIAGHGFLYRASLNLECGGTVDATGTLVGAGWAPVPGTGATDFEIDWIVAAELMPQQQRGGGPVVPGSTCRFTMHPPQADAGFTITEH